MIKKLYATFIAVATLLICGATQAQDGISVQEGGYEIFYSVFNSKFLTPEIASTYDLVRDRDQALLNVVVTLVDAPEASLGVPAKLEGQASNLIQQSQSLDFKTIEEQNTVYYLAPIKHTNEEVFNFKVQVTPKGSEKTIDLKFSKKLYVDK